MNCCFKKLSVVYHMCCLSKLVVFLKPNLQTKVAHKIHFHANGTALNNYIWTLKTYNSRTAMYYSPYYKSVY